MFGKEKLLVFITFIGFLSGILYVNIIAEEYLSVTGIFNQYYLSEFATNEMEMQDYLPIVIRIRCLPILLLIALAYSRVNKVGVFIFCAWTGFLWGNFMSLCIVQLGVIGILLCILSLIPHMFFYLPAYIIVVLFVYKQPSGRWTWEKICAVLICLILGIILECKVNPIILKWFINVL